MIDLSEIEIVRFKGLEIPNELIHLTNGGSGLMMFWMQDQREMMGASAIKYEGKWIAWAAYRKQEEGFYDLGTFVEPSFRKQGLGQMALTHLLVGIKMENALAYGKYGASLVIEFNRTYERTILACGLKSASIFMSNEQIKNAA